MQEEATMYGQSEEEDTTKPSIVYMARVSKEVRAKMLKQAFGRARRQADGIATAVGVKLGKIASVQSSNPEQAMSSYMSYYGRSPAASPLTADEMQQNASGDEPTQLSFSVQVVAAFELSSGS